jgi:hypothetical protein
MLVGLLRFIQNESTNVQMQVVDFACGDEITSHVSGEAFLRFINTAVAAKSDRLCTLEPELAVTGGKTLTPRIIPIPDMNVQWNSFRRTIRHSTTRSTHVSLGGRHQASGISTTKICIKTSTAFAVRVGASCYLYFVLGHVVATGQRVLALSPNSEGEPDIPSNCIHTLPYNFIKDDSLLLRAFVICSRILFSNRPQGKPFCFTTATGAWSRTSELPPPAPTKRLRLSRQPLLQTTACRYRTSSPTHMQPKARITAALPSRLDVFVDFTPLNTAETASSENVIRSLQDRCTVLRLSDIVSSEHQFQPFGTRTRSRTNFDLSPSWTATKIVTSGMTAISRKDPYSGALLQPNNPML